MVFGTLSIDSLQLLKS